jgi:hypothetical protein
MGNRYSLLIGLSPVFRGAADLGKQGFEAGELGAAGVRWGGGLSDRPQLGHLSEAATVAFFEECSRRYALGWGPGEIQELARAVDGFPLGMREAVAAERRRRETVKNGGGVLLKER